MKLTLTENEIDEALTQYVFNTISLREGTEINISYTAGRGERGLTAEIDINYLSVEGINLKPSENRVQTVDDDVAAKSSSAAEETPARKADSIFADD